KVNGKAMANCTGCGGQWDGKMQTAMVGSFDPNGFGLFDMVSNVSSWTEDCWNDSYEGAPNDGSAWTRSGCTVRATRGGSLPCPRPPRRFLDTPRASPGLGSPRVEVPQRSSQHPRLPCRSNALRRSRR